MYCSFQAYDPGTLQRHFYMEHAVQTEGGVKKRDLSKEEGPYKCSWCPQKFLTTEGLEHHCALEHQGKLI